MFLSFTALIASRSRSSRCSALVSSCAGPTSALRSAPSPRIARRCADAADPQRVYFVTSPSARDGGARRGAAHHSSTGASVSSAPRSGTITFRSVCSAASGHWSALRASFGMSENHLDRRVVFRRDGLRDRLRVFIVIDVRPAGRLLARRRMRPGRVAGARSRPSWRSGLPPMGGMRQVTSSTSLINPHLVFHRWGVVGDVAVSASSPLGHGAVPRARRVYRDAPLEPSTASRHGSAALAAAASRRGGAGRRPIPARAFQVVRATTSPRHARRRRSRAAAGSARPSGTGPAGPSASRSSPDRRQSLAMQFADKRVFYYPRSSSGSPGSGSGTVWTGRWRRARWRRSRGLRPRSVRRHPRDTVPRWDHDASRRASRGRRRGYAQYISYVNPDTLAESGVLARNVVRGRPRRMSGQRRQVGCEDPRER